MPPRAFPEDICRSGNADASAGRLRPWLWLILVCLWPLPGQSADSPQVLPQVRVGAGVPLIKLGEHRMRERRFAPAVVASGHHLYIIGGRNEASALASVERFDLRTGKSEPFAVLRTPRLWHAAVLAGNRIVVLGGSTPNGDGGTSLHSFSHDLASAKQEIRQHFGGLNAPPPPRSGPVSSPREELLGIDSAVEFIDLETGAVSPGPAMPVAKTQFACVQSGSQVFVFGGQAYTSGQRGFTNSVEILDLVSGKWTRGAPSPTARAGTAIAIAGGLIVYLGGYTGRGVLADVDLFNPTTQAWRSLPPLCRGISAHSGVFLGHHLFLFGDYASPNQIIAYDLKTRQSEVFRLGYAEARHTAAVAHQDKIYVVGGRPHVDAPPLDLIQVFGAPGGTAGR